MTATETNEKRLYLEFWQMISAISIALIVMFTASADKEFWSHSFALGSLVILRWYRWREDQLIQYSEDRDDLYHHLWLLDAFLLALAAVETSTINLLFFSALSVTFSPLIKELIDDHQQKKRNLSRAMATTVSLAVLTLFWESHQVSLSPVREGLILLAGMGTLWINIQMIEDKHWDKDTKTSLVVTEKLFFHDLINHTHGLLLSLESRRDQATDKEAREQFGHFAHEIEKLQLLVQDHYKYHHKNLKGLKPYLKVSELEAEAHRIFENYLPAPDWNIHWHGDVSFDGELPAATFVRIITNLAKNMAESHAMEGEIHLSTNPDQLVIKTRNRISKEYRPDPSAPWKHHALNDQFRELGSGLKSIHRQCQSLKGQFLFVVEGEYWVNKLTIPLKFSSISKLDKKAA